MKQLRLCALSLLIWLSAGISLKAQDDLLNMLESDIATKMT
ncbi:MAG: hypothetical protein U5K79_15840 [Cyclobacteriaceae bacterium]|nr:hypothetical protein [Cyclobacteriaceae bacterium]